ARFEGPEREVAIRLADHAGSLFLDLADAAGRGVEISPDGWGLATACPIRFRRPPGMCALPWPERGGSIQELRPLVNVHEDIDWQLLVGWILGAFQPRGPYAVPEFAG